MRKFLLSLSFCFIFLFSLSSALTLDFSEYNLPDFDSADFPSATMYSNYILYYQNGSANLNFSSSPMRADSSRLYVSGSLTQFYINEGNWSLSNFDNGEDYGAEYSDYSAYSSITTSNYIVYDNEDNSVIIYNPIQNEGGEYMATVLTDLTTVMSSVLSNATSLVTWITQNPLVYLWVIMAIIIAIISFVRGFIRGV